MKIVRNAIVTSAERRDPGRYRCEPVCRLALLVDVGGEPHEMVVSVSGAEFDMLWRDVAMRKRVKMTLEFQETPKPVCPCGRKSGSDGRWCGNDCDAAWRYKPAYR